MPAFETIEMCMPCGCQPKGEFATPDGSQKVPLITQSLLPTTTPTHIIHASLILESEHILGRMSPDNDEIDDHLNDSFSPWLNRFPDEDPFMLIYVTNTDVSLVMFCRQSQLKYLNLN